MKNTLWNDMKIVARGIREIQKKSPLFLFNSFLYAFFQSAQPFVSIFFSARIIDGILEKAPLQTLVRMVLWLVGMECICTIIMKCMDGVLACESRKFFASMRLDVAAKLFRIDYEKMEDPEVQRQKEKIETAADRMGLGLSGICETLPLLLRYASTILLSMALTVRLFFSFEKSGSGWQAWVCSPVFSALLAGIIFASVLVNMKLTSESRNKEYQLYSGLEKVTNKLNYYANNYVGNYRNGKDIRIYGQKPMLMEEMQEETQKLYGWYRNFQTVRMRYGNWGSVISVGISGLVYLFVGLKALAGMFSVGSIVQYVGSINQFVSGLTDFMKQLTDLRANNEALGYYFDFMEIPDTKMEEGISLAGEPKEIEFQNVSFKYPGTEVYVIQNLSVKFQAGKKTAIVGMNGSGKTTLIKLLCRLYQPTEGKITLNGIDIQDYKYADYLQQIAVVFQDFKLFAYTLGENVAASSDMDKEKVEEALSKAGFGERYQSLEKGTDTYLYKEYDENGVEISGGEAQKIAISRALYKDAPIVILDEPTAALDPISEFEIYSHFNQMVEDKMAIFISHRLSSCRFCDEIVVMDSGELVQLGNHETLVADENGKYYELWNAQAQYYKEEVTNEKGNESVPTGMANFYQ